MPNRRGTTCHAAVAVQNGYAGIGIAYNNGVEFSLTPDPDTHARNAFMRAIEEAAAATPGGKSLSIHAECPYELMPGRLVPLAESAATNTPAALAGNGTITLLAPDRKHPLWIRATILAEYAAARAHAAAMASRTATRRGFLRPAA